MNKRLKSITGNIAIGLFALIVNQPLQYIIIRHDLNLMKKDHCREAIVEHAKFLNNSTYHIPLLFYGTNKATSEYLK